MAEPEVRYCTTSDGVQIAFRVSGEGPRTPLVFMMAPPFGGLKWPEALGGPAFSGRRWAMLDFRGTGLSDRRITDMSMAALTLDLEAVVERLGWSRDRRHDPSRRRARGCAPRPRRSLRTPVGTAHP